MSERRPASALRGVLRVWPQAASASALVALWELDSSLRHPSWLPTVESVASSWWRLVTGGAFHVAVTSLETLAIGLAVVLAAGAVAAGLLARFRLLDEALTPLLNAAMATPVVALVPVFVLIWGFSDTTRVIAVVAFAFAPLVLQWIVALKSVPEHLTEMSYAFAAGRLARVRTIVLPAVAPLLLNGARIAVVQAIKGVITAEMIIGVVGVGKLIVTASETFDMAQLYAVVLTVVAVSVASYVVLSTLEHRSSRWADA
jgi:ABC-type nitrate/sulfonate/bicarbonate transport system permease component